MRQVLFAEQNMTTFPDFTLVPIEMESTVFGESFADLKQVTSIGKNSLEPYTYASFRIIH